jgi:outer membrane cobalamin receptor
MTYLGGTSSVDRTQFRSELGANSVMTSGFGTTLVTAASRYTASPRLLVSNRLAWSSENGHVSNRDDALLSNQNYHEWTWHGDGTFVWREKNNLSFGGEARRVGQNSQSQQFIYTPVLNSALDAVRGSQVDDGAYIQQALNLGRARITAGVRGDHNNVSPVSTFSPYTSLAFDLSAKTHLSMDWGQYAQFPELDQFLSRFIQGKLLPERATHYEVVLERRVSDRMRIQVEAYDRQDRDLLARPALEARLLPDGSVFDPTPAALWLNSGRGYARGVQFVIQRRSANGVTGWVSYAYGRAVIRDGYLNAKFPSDYDQRHTVNAYLSRRVRPTVNLSMHFTFGSGMPLPGFYRTTSDGYALSQERNALRAPIYQRTDVRLNKDYVHQKFKTTLFAEIINLTDRSNSDFDTAGPFDPVTGRAVINFFSMLPILPSAGVVFEF